MPNPQGYIIGRTMGFLPAWQAVWSAVSTDKPSSAGWLAGARVFAHTLADPSLQLWSLTVAVTLPRAGASSRQSANFLSAPWFLNAHFIGLAIACCIAIGVPSIMSGIHFDRAVVHFEACTSVYRALSSSYPSMTEDEVMTGLLSQSNELQGILDEFNLFGPLFSYAWSCWLAFILYAYSVFLVVSVFYFSYLRRSMNKIKNLEGKSLERKALQKTWWFAVLTSALVTMTGRKSPMSAYLYCADRVPLLVLLISDALLTPALYSLPDSVAYAGAALFMTVNLDAAIGTATGLRVITFLSLYSEAGLGLIAAILSLAQTLVGSQKATLGSGSNTGATGGRYIGGKSTGLGGVGTTAGGVSVSIATRTHIESDSAVVQLELADWAEKDGMDETSEKRLQYSNPL